MADGSVVIDTKMDLKGFEEGTKQASSKILKLNNSIDQTERSIAELTNEMLKMENVDVPTKEYADLTRQIATAEKQFDLLSRQIESLEDQGQPYGTLPQQTERLLVKIDALKKKQADLDKQFIKGSETTQYQKMEQQVESLNNKLAVQKQQLTEIKEKEDAVANSAKKIANESQKGFTAMISGGKNAGKSLKETTAGIERLTKRLLNVVASVFVFTVLNKAFTALRDSMGGALMANEQFSASLAQIKSNLATAFYPIYQAALPAINALMDALAKITGTIATFISMLFGTTVSQAQAGAASLKKQATGISSVGDAAKKASKNLAGFDDAQILSEKQDTSGGVGGGASSGTQEVGEVKTNPKLLAWLTDLQEKLAPLVAALKRLWNALVPFAGNVFQGFINFFASLLGSDFVVGIINLLAAALENIDPSEARSIGEALAFLATIILGYKIGSTVYTALTGLVGLLKTLAATKGGQILLSIAVAYIGFGVGNKIYEWITGEEIDLSIGEQISEILDTLFNDFDIFKEAVGMMFDDLGQKILGLFGLDGVTWEDFKGGVSLMWSDFKETMGQIPTFFSNVGSKIKNTITGIPGFFKEKFNSAWGNIKSAFSNVQSFFSGIVTKIKNLFSNVGSSIASAVGRTFASGVNTIFSKIESIVNGFINKINSVIGAINKIPGVKLSKISTISLPRLSTGTVVPANFGEFAAILGDNKREPEVVSPLSTIEKAVDNVMSKYAGGSENINVVVTLDGEVVYRNVVKRNKRNTKLTGKNALAY